MSAICMREEPGKWDGAHCIAADPSGNRGRQRALQRESPPRTAARKDPAAQVPALRAGADFGCHVAGPRPRRIRRRARPRASAGSSPWHPMLEMAEAAIAATPTALSEGSRPGFHELELALRTCGFRCGTV
mmetsp:Transcript_37248/g.88532  ORF Transcript_37248/g.88532 Transcript_37248/m.88532 type:complete len:131 (-) Transcript_37248:721-1113(-)